MDILDIDEILKDDSFCNLSADQKMDESITSILQQWKQNEVALGPKGTKLVDTRTFTRPKKRGMGESDHEGVLPASGINLQVGGLVTSMRRSLIGETSPPSSFCSSVDSMNEEMLNSLINSGDFNNVSFFMENMEESPNINFNGYNLEDVIRDRQFIDNLTSSEDQTFSKDASICRTDDHMVSADSSDSNPLIDVTMKLNPNFEGTFIAKDTTFNTSNQILGIEPLGSETFNLMGDTSIENVIGQVNETFKCDAPKANTTFGISVDKNTSLEGNNLTYIEGNKRNQTFTEPKQQEVATKKDQPEKIDSKTPPDSSEWIFQSTPLKTSKTKVNQKKISLSPIKCNNINSSLNLSKEGNFEKYLQEATDQIFTPDKLLEKPQFEQSPESPEEEEEVVERRRLPIPINMLREEERQSLRNFEEYEKTLMQDNDKEFDDVLSRFATMELRQSNEKMRQSLDSIKKRHSLVNLEKQQQEDENRGHVDSNKLSESLGKSRRLLRRSRIYDEVNNTHSQSPDRDKVQETEPPPQAESERVPPPSKGNRDRFKTIRIFRPPDQNSPHLPDAGDTMVDNVNTEIPVVVPPEPPKVIEMEKKVTPMEPHGFKKPSVPVRNIPKPKYFKSALAKPMSQQKFNSADDLLDSEEPQVHPATQSLKSPMGIKSKSIHNLLSGQRPMASMEKLNSNQCDFKFSADGINKTHPNSKLSLVAPSSKFGKSNQSLARVSSKQSTSDVERYKIDSRTQVGNHQSNMGSAIMRNNPKRLGLVRPSSGYYSYSVKRNDSDTESGRYSPQSLSSSSASSKGSLYVPEVSQNPDTNTFDSHQSYNSLQPDAMKRPNSVTSKVPRPTGLRLPSNFRTAGGASAVPRPSGIPRR